MSRSKGPGASKLQNGTSTAKAGDVNKKAKSCTAEATAAAQFNTNVKPVLEADIRAIRDAVGPLNCRTLGAQARSILLCVVCILQLAWSCGSTQAVVGAAGYLGVSAANTLWHIGSAGSLHIVERGVHPGASLELWDHSDSRRSCWVPRSVCCQHSVAARKTLEGKRAR